MSQLSNHRPEVIDNFQLQGGFCPGDDRLPASDPAAFGGLSFWVEYFSADRRSGRFLAGPFEDRRRAVRRAAQMLAETQDGRRVEGVSIKQYRA